MKKVLLVILSVLCSVAVYGQDGRRSESVVTIGGDRYYVHVVDKGETLYSLARLYEIPQEEIVKDNPQVKEGLKAGEAIKIRARGQGTGTLSGRKHSKTFDTHIVNQGETLYAISRRYEIPVSTLMEDNPGLDPARISIGQKLNIRKKSKGDASEEEIKREIEEYSEAFNSVSDSHKYHFVAKGETLYGIAGEYGVETQEIRSANGLQDDDIKEGDILIIPVAASSSPIPPGEDGGVEYLYPDSLGHADLGRSRDRIPVERLKVRDFGGGRGPLKVAMILPLQTEGGKGDNMFLDFYRGSLLALEQLRRDGVSADITLYNSGRSEEKVMRIVEDEAFDGTDIVIGPVYEECMFPVIDFAETTGAAVISPLATVDPECSPMLYQMAPSSAGKYDKLRDELDAERNIVYVTTGFPDNELDSLFRPMLPEGYATVAFSGKVATRPFNSLAQRGKNTFVVSCTDELTTDQILAALSSLQSNVVARGGSMEISVIGSSRWSRFRSRVDKNLFFKLGVSFVTSYHADRSHQNVREFSRRYISTFSAIPTLYSYRGYDVARLAIGAAAAGGDYTEALNTYEGGLLQMPYGFEQEKEYGAFVNTQWALVKYHTDYTVEVK